MEDAWYDINVDTTRSNNGTPFAPVEPKKLCGPIVYTKTWLPREKECATRSTANSALAWGYLWEKNGENTPTQPMCVEWGYLWEKNGWFRVIFELRNPFNHRQPVKKHNEMVGVNIPRSSLSKETKNQIKLDEETVCWYYSVSYTHLTLPTKA